MTIGEIYFNCSPNFYGQCKLLNTWSGRYSTIYLFGRYGDDGTICDTYTMNERDVRQYIEVEYENY